MVNKIPDRKMRKGISTGSSETETALANFKLPESLSSSKIDFPVLIKRQTKVNWKEIIEESENFQKELKEFEENKLVIVKPQFLKTECDYIRNEVFVHLIPAIIETLNKAKIWDVLVIQKSFFNGIDHIAQTLWNNNPRYPGRKFDNLHLFNMTWVRNALIRNPRSLYPKSWLWPEDYAAQVIQKSLRRYFVQRTEEVTEMRDFWKKLEFERAYPELNVNPLLSKKLASTTKHTKH